MISNPFARLGQRLAQFSLTPNQHSAVPDDLTYANAYYFLTQLEGDDAKLQIEHRGLSFGDLKVDRTFGRMLELSTPYEKTKDVTLDEIYACLDSIIGLPFGIPPNAKLKTDETWHEVSLTASGHRGRDGSVFDLRVKKSDGYPLTVEAWGQEELGIAFELARLLNLSIEPIHYAHESNVPLGVMVDYAYAWTDQFSKQIYTEILYDPTYEKQLVYVGGGRNRTFTQGQKKIIVLAGTQSRIRLNTMDVKPQKISFPTLRMLRARHSIRRGENKRNRCSMAGCGKKAVHQIFVPWDRVSFGGFVTETGHVIYSCGNPKHLDFLKSSGGLRVRVSPFVVHEYEKY